MFVLFCNIFVGDLARYKTFESQNHRRVFEMSTRKRTSIPLVQAQQRLAGIKTINPAPVLAPNLTLAGFEDDINALSDMVIAFNQQLTALDKSRDALERAESSVSLQNQRMLATIKGHYGPDSDEYKQAGGTRLSDRKRPERKSHRASLPQSQPSAN
jgi:hypothetical protein